ncbi:MAG: hypothetical protein ACTS5F_02115 [Candidatus Hodgkinia cicadicola]
MKVEQHEDAPQLAPIDGFEETGGPSDGRSGGVVERVMKVL